MTKFLRTFWRGITYPFVLIYNSIAFPFRAIRRFLRSPAPEPEDRPLMDPFSSLATEAETRQSLWDHVEALRSHLLRSIVWLALGVGILSVFKPGLVVI